MHSSVSTTARREAFKACGGGQWKACEDKLDKAKTLDPDGEDDPRVHAARDAIREALYPDSGLGVAKPGPRP